MFAAVVPTGWSDGRGLPSHPQDDDRPMECDVATCRACGNEMVEIALTIDGSDLMMRSCSICDTRSWHRDGESVALDGVLHDISAVPTRYRRSLSS